MRSGVGSMRGIGVRCGPSVRLKVATGAKEGVCAFRRDRGLDHSNENKSGQSGSGFCWCGIVGVRGKPCSQGFTIKELVGILGDVKWLGFI